MSTIIQIGFVSATCKSLKVSDVQWGPHIAIHLLLESILSPCSARFLALLLRMVFAKRVRRAHGRSIQAEAVQKAAAPVGEKAEEAVRELASKASREAQPAADQAKEQVTKAAKGAKAGAQSLGDQAADAADTVCTP